MAGGTNAKLRQRVEQLEALVGQALEVGSDSSVLARMGHLKADYAARYETTLEKMASVRKDEEKLREEVVQLRRALQNNAPRNNDRTKYFQDACVPNDEKVTITPMYLTDDAKVWWRTRVVDAESAGLPKIETWETLKKELKSQFLPTNSSWVARDGLRHLKQSGTVREYVKELSSLMLNVSNMAEEDKLHYFMSGLKGWAQLELRRQNVQSLSTAVAAADALADLNIVRRKEGQSEGIDARGKGQAAKDVGFAKNRRQTETSKGKERSGKFNGFFTCGGPHLKRDCPVQARVIAMLAAERLEQVAEANAIVANVNEPQGDLYVNNLLGLIR
ncbi:uncharacterized protein [Nicotiana tomentosiformis]|uniref:uncharacterized protein n=1 Tax=Nicotiana tomentosiformis TaxID=4098 RepID=UPI00388CB696